VEKGIDYFPVNDSIKANLSVGESRSTQSQTPRPASHVFGFALLGNEEKSNGA